uniref:Neprosin PEP catalytic domain-containing protein n=1 Tax=Nicotiana tabacum TaxID=4097 RepID=A0A1S4CG15_TOBAC
MEKQLKLSNKSAVKTIKMKPILSRKKQNLVTSSTNQSPRIWLNGKGCPSGTVPIKRITKDDLIRQTHMPPPEDVTFDVQLVATNNNSEPKGIYRSSQGYKVDPTLYGDNKTRLFIHFQAGNKHCFNTLCPGFVLVNTEIPVDMVYDQVSHRGDKASLEDTMSIGR